MGLYVSQYTITMDRVEKEKAEKNYVCVYVKLFHVYKLILNNYKQISQVLFRKKRR